MRLVTWNAGRGPFNRKAPWLDHLHCDIAVIQEIGCPPQQDAQVQWFGVNPRQGVAVLARAPYRLTPMPQMVGAPAFFVPIAVTGPQVFQLYAVWTLGSQPCPYVEAANQCIDMYLPDESPLAVPVVAMGDFNSNAVWDGKRPNRRNHTAMVERLARRGLVSAFHADRGVAHGAEPSPTFWHRSNKRGFHIDYCFLPAAWALRIRHVDIGTHAAWKLASDHVPLLVDLEDPIGDPRQTDRTDRA